MTIRRSCLTKAQASAAPPRSNANRIVGTHRVSLMEEAELSIRRLL